MTKNNDITRRDMIVGATTVLGAAVLPSVALAQDEGAAVEAFYRGQKYTYCDAKVLAHFWNGTTDGNAVGDAKVSAGQMILNRQGRQLTQKLKDAYDGFVQAGQECTFDDANNPPYTYDDAAALAAFWEKDWGGTWTPYDAKLKIALNLPGGGNSWVLAELAKAGR